MDHLAPIWDRLPGDMRGWLHVDIRGVASKPVEPDDFVMVAASGDIRPKWRCIYVEHGAGQRYNEYGHRDAPASYAVDLPDNVVACIGPRQDICDAYDRPAFPAGAPICDGYPLFGEPGVIAITFHWNASAVCPEATNALDHYYTDLGRLIVGWRKQGHEVLGTYHPRFPQLVDRWNGWRVPIVGADEVRQRADILIADNTSVQYEATYLGRKVVTLNAPWFRRDVEHGLRFWSHVPGVQVDSAEELEALDMSNLVGGWRGDVSEYTYGSALNAGQDGMRAAAWVTSFVHSV